MGEPVIFVAPNYRVNAYGFLHGKEIQEAALANLGLSDQRKALEWGEITGTASVFDHMIINNDTPLFHEAIMISGTFINAVGTAHPKFPDAPPKLISDFIATCLHIDLKTAQFGTYHTSDLGTQFFLQ
ncbi:hypothetical protein FSARC_7766 [Fusarium sarcochroum]|uniref:Carboxylesterase type B domain-containing protein n=1 Tax=Fusarium sarcochroum TaxID=1208366 RepID=A0A8H4X7Z2_9HYPO|nr:hypothetical protein FSARC_7766 [Fusarium sarcochroum]